MEADRSRQHLFGVLPELPDHDALISFFWTTDGEGRFVVKQPGWAAFTGQSWEEYRDFGWLNAYHPDDRNIIIQRVAHVMATREPFKVQARVWHAPSQRYHLTAGRGIEVYNHDGSFREWVGLVIDLEAQRAADAEMKATRERLAVLFDQSIVGIAQVRKDGHFVYANKGCSDLFGYSAGEFLKVSLFDLVHQNDQRVFTSEWDRLFMKGGTVQLDLRFLKGGGDMLRARISLTAIEGRDGKTESVLAMVSDLTAAFEAEQRARELEQETAKRLRLESIFNRFFSVSLDGMCVSTLDGRTISANDAFCRLMARSREEIIAESFMNFVHPDDLEKTRMALAQLRQGKPVQGFVNRYRRGDGEIVYLSWTTVPEENNLYGIVRDITQTIKGEEALRDAAVQAELVREEAVKARLEAERANQAKDEFLATLSHELRTPLTPVLMVASSLEANENLPLAVREEIAMLRRNVELEARLIDDLLDLTRISKGKLALRKSEGGIHGLINQTKEIVLPEAIAGGVEIDFALSAEDCVVDVDRARMQQVIWNLLKNAIKFTLPGGRVTVTTSNPEPGVFQLSVRDTGIGIEKEAMGKIFDAFEQTEGARQFGGLGLGLAISKVIVEMHGGRIEVSSEGLGKGAQFDVFLENSDVARINKGDGEALLKPAFKALRFLIVEDHEQTAMALQRILERRGHQVQVASSVMKGIALGLEEDFDLLISDIGLPDGMGYDVIRELSAKRGLRGIALSGFGTEDDMKKTREAGFEAHLVKPINVEHLFQVIGEVVGR